LLVLPSVFRDRFYLWVLCGGPLSAEQADLCQNISPDDLVLLAGVGASFGATLAVRVRFGVTFICCGLSLSPSFELESAPLDSIIISSGSWQIDVRLRPAPWGANPVVLTSGDVTAEASVSKDDSGRINPIVESLSCCYYIVVVIITVLGDEVRRCFTAVALFKKIEINNVTITTTLLLVR